MKVLRSSVIVGALMFFIGSATTWGIFVPPAQPELAVPTKVKIVYDDRGTSYVVVELDGIKYATTGGDYINSPWVNLKTGESVYYTDALFVIDRYDLVDIVDKWKEKQVLSKLRNLSKE